MITSPVPHLTRCQCEYLLWVQHFLQEHTYPPTMRELATGQGVTVRAAYQILLLLTAKGFVRSAFRRARTLEVIRPITCLPVLGEIDSATGDVQDAEGMVVFDKEGNLLCEW